MPIDYKPLNERLLAVGARAECLICGHNNWVGLGPDRTEFTLLPTANELDEWETGRALAVATWACANCGFLRLHSLDILS